MELTICVCDNCKTEHRLNPDAEAHGHGHMGRRIPSGWTVIELTHVEAPRATGPDAMPPLATMRPHAASTLQAVVNTLTDPSVSDETAREALMQFVDGMAPYSRAYDAGAVPMLHQHIEAKHASALLCSACTPQIKHADGSDIKLVEPRGYGPGVGQVLAGSVGA